MTRAVFLWILSLCFFLPARAQQVKQYSFKHFSMVNGLASNMVNRIMQDRDGYIWVATVNGLQRYDGSSFIAFKHQKNNPTSIPADNITQLYLDRNGNLWLLSGINNVGIFNTKTFTYRAIPIRNRLKLYVQHLSELPSGELLLQQEKGYLYQYDAKAQEFITADQIFPPPPKWIRHQLLWDSLNKKYWMGCDSGLAMYDPATRNLNYRGHNIDNDPTIRNFEKTLRPIGLYVDLKGNLNYIFWPPNAAGASFYRYDRQKQRSDTFEFTSQLGYHETLGMLRQRNGRFWIYGMPFFAEWSEYQPKLNRIPNEYKNEQSARYDYVNHAYEDKESNIWLATDNGVYVFNPDRQIFNTYNLARPDGKPSFENLVQAVEQLSDGRLLVGCWGSGLYCFDRNINPIPLPRGLEKGEKYSVWDMAIHPFTRELWITQQGGIISVYNEKTGKLQEVSPAIFNGSTIRQLDEDTAGNIWFGAHNGLVVKWDYKKSGGDPTKGYEYVLKTGMVHKIHYDYQGYIYVATLGRGLVKIDAKTNKVVKTYTADGPEGEKLFDNSPGDMTYYNDTTLIITAGCINILNTKTGKIRFFSTDEGLPSNTAQSVEKDAKNILWIGMLNGICRLNLEKGITSYYDRRDGIAHDKFSMAGIKELADGTLVFYTDRNFLVFDPSRFGQQDLPPRPYITSFKLAGESLSMDSILKTNRAVLRYNNTSVAINFSGLSFLQQRKVHFYYMLENLDDDWIRSDGPKEIVYNYLPPGNYVFKVKSVNADGITSDQIATLPITVRAPVWKSWWFFSLIGLLVMAVLYLLDKERMNKRNSLQQMRRQIRSNLHDDISTALNNINVLSEIAKIKADKNVEQSKVFIDQISDKSRQMMDAMDDMIWSIDPENDSMKKTVLRIKELTDGIRIGYNLEIDLIVDHKVQELEMDMKLRHDLFFFYKQAISYIVQHIPTDQIFVNINKVKSKLLIEILCECQDNVEEARIKFKVAMGPRLKNLPASMETIAENHSFAVVLYVDLK